MVTSDLHMEIKCSDNVLEQVVSFKPLGRTIENTGSISKEVIARISEGNSTFNRLNKVGKLSTFSLQRKLCLLNSNVLPFLLYAWETWHLKQGLEGKIHSFENACLQSLLGIRWIQKATNARITNIAGQPSLIETIRRRGWRYLGQVLRLNDTTIRKQTFF